MIGETHGDEIDHAKRAICDRTRNHNVLLAYGQVSNGYMQDGSVITTITIEARKRPDGVWGMPE